MNDDKLIHRIPELQIKGMLSRIDKTNADEKFQNRLKEFYFLNSDDVSIDGKEINSIVERNLFLMKGQAFHFEACKTKDGFELTEMDFIEKEYGIIEKGRQFTENNFRLRKQLAIYVAYLNQRKAVLIQKPQQKNKVSFIWQGNAKEELPELYRLMLNEYKLIAPDTNLRQFEAVFTGQPIESIEPVKWIESNRLLAYFLDMAFNGQDWQSIAGNGNLFLNKKGKSLNSNDLAVAKKSYSDYGKPKGYEKIDLILSTIKKH